MHHAFTLLALTGMRRGEALGLRWSDIDFDAFQIAIVQTVTAIEGKVVMGGPKTAGSRRTVYIHDATIKALRSGLGGPRHSVEELVDGLRRHDDSPAEAKCRQVAGANALIGRRPGDAEDRGDLGDDHRSGAGHWAVVHDVASLRVGNGRRLRKGHRRR
jgi:integrase